MLSKVLIVYFICISIVAVVMTIYDKLVAIHHKWRISEFSLLLVSALGGSIAMLVTMLVIRHKTRKLKFMLGIPLVILLQSALLLFVMVKL